MIFVFFLVSKRKLVESSMSEAPSKKKIEITPLSDSIKSDVNIYFIFEMLILHIDVLFSTVKRCALFRDLYLDQVMLSGDLNLKKSSNDKVHFPYFLLQCTFKFLSLHFPKKEEDEYFINLGKTLRNGLIEKMVRERISLKLNTLKAEKIDLDFQLSKVWDIIASEYPIRKEIVTLLNNINHSRHKGKGMNLTWVKDKDSNLNIPELRPLMKMGVSAKPKTKNA